GEKLVSECNSTEDSVCTRCETGHYQQGWTREKHCAPHDICDDNTGLIVKTQGNATHNTVCQCRDGMHCSDTSCQTCVENQPCQRGFGFVAAKAVARMSSPCEPCAEGTFSNVSSKTEPCHPWTRYCLSADHILCPSPAASSPALQRSVAGAWERCGHRGGGCSCLPLTPAPVQIGARQHRELENKPTEIDDEAFPVQETLLRGQPVAQEDGKESRMSEQERP
ncbi:TNR5 factor, partial [Columbina picui]|nr:TNR5 factor [Columbina picui]